MKRLAFDTSTPQIVLGIFDGKNWTEFEQTEDLTPHKQQSKVLFSVLKGFLADQNISALEITEIAIGQGPGSYTGLRVGLTVGKIWSFALEVPLFTFSSEKLFERTRKNYPEAKAPKLCYLVAEDFTKVEDLQNVGPIYTNDHFS